MSDNFNLKRFLTENKLTTNARALGDVNEESQSIGLTLTPGEVSAVLDALASSNIENNISKAGQMQSGGNRILANLAQATAKLKNAYYPNPQADLAEEGKKTVRLTADNLKYPFIDDTKHAILDKEYCDKIGIAYNVGDGANIGGIVFKVIRVIEPYFYLLEKQNTQEDLAEEVHNEGTNASWKDLWDALQAALAKESDAEADNALKVIAKAAASKVGAHVKGKLEKYNDSLDEGTSQERLVYDVVEDSVSRALSAIENYKENAQTDQSGDLGVFHDVEVALEDVLDFLMYTQNTTLNEEEAKKFIQKVVKGTKHQ